SGYKDKIGAAAILFRTGCHPRKLLFNLGTKEEHTVYEVEAVGLRLATEFITTEDDLVFPISVFVHNQAVIQSSENFYLKPGTYLIDCFCNRINCLAVKVILKR
ncbi:hypothetical protein BDR07DRAFT_1313321, partial [Suillus spraguei]